MVRPLNLQWIGPALVVAISGCGIAMDRLSPPAADVEVPCAGVDLGELRLFVTPGFPMDSIGLESLEDGILFNVRWPSGFSVEPTDEGVVIFNRGGSIVAREGHVLQIGGGHGGSGTITVCEIDGEIYT